MLSKLSPAQSPPEHPQRIVLIRPCCIGDVVLATATLKALRRRYPQAQITWAIGRWSRAAIADHPLLDDLLDTGTAALPVKSARQMWRFIKQLRAGQFDLAVSLVRSPFMSLAVLLSGIPYRAGLDSAGRGFGYNIRVPLDPHAPRHEAELYLDVARALGADTSGCYANIPVDSSTPLPDTIETSRPYIIIHPGGGNNPGMTMDSKRWPPEYFAGLANRLIEKSAAQFVQLIAGPDDGAIVEAVRSHLNVPHQQHVGTLDFNQIARLAHRAVLYIGNDSGLTHFAAATGTPTAMILGPSDPVRYAPFAPNSIALWKPAPIHHAGVASGTPSQWDWPRDGIGVDEAENQILTFLRQAATDSLAD